MINKLYIILLSILMIILAGCEKVSDSTEDVKQASTPSAESEKIITDKSGAKVQVPTKINRIADTWGAHNEILTALGAGQKIVATTLTADVRPWLYKVNPQMKNAVTAFSIDASDINIEELLQTKPDIVFLSVGNKNINKISDLGNSGSSDRL